MRFTLQSDSVRFLGLGLSLVLPSAGQADNLHVWNAPLQHALYDKHADTSVVCGRLTELVDPLRLGTELVLVDEIRIAITKVVLDRGWPTTEDDELQLTSGHLRWPIEMVDPREGQSVLLLVVPDFVAPGNHYVETLLPWTGQTLVAVTSEVEAMDAIEKDLLASLRNTDEAERQVALLRTIAPVLEEEGASKIEHLLEHSNERVRRAALGATMYAVPTPETAKKIGADVTRFFDGLADAECSKATAGCGSVIRDELFTSYLFLNPRARRWGSRWNEEEAEFYGSMAEMVAIHLDLTPEDLATLFPADAGRRADPS